MNRPIIITKVESLILKLPINKIPGPDGFRGELYQIFKTYPFETIPECCRDGTLLNPLYQATVTLCVEIFLVLLGVQGLLLVFSKCCVRITPYVDVFLMYL